MPKIKMQTEFDVPDDVFEQGIEKAIKNNPDYVLVVRCKDCAHCDPENRHCDHPMGTAIPIPRKADDFCSYGERRTDDG